MGKCSQDVADVDFTVGCDSTPPYPVRCPVKYTLVYASTCILHWNEFGEMVINNDTGTRLPKN